MVITERHLFHVVDIIFVRRNHPNEHSHEEDHKDQQGDDGIYLDVFDSTQYVLFHFLGDLGIRCCGFLDVGTQALQVGNQCHDFGIRYHFNSC
jgi:hypothetical protein